jgi:hypothetical protein
MKVLNPTSKGKLQRKGPIDLPNTLNVQERVLEAKQFVVSLGRHCV